MPDAYKTRMEIDSTLGFERLARIFDGLIADGRLGEGAVRPVPGQGGGRFYQLGSATKAPIVNLWPTKDGKAVFDISEQTLDGAGGAKDSMISMLLLMGRMKKISRGMLPFYGHCEIFRDAILVEDPGAKIALTQQ